MTSQRRFTRPLVALLSATCSSKSITIRNTSIRKLLFTRTISSSSMFRSTENTFECSDGVTLATCHWSNNMDTTMPKTDLSSMSSSSSAASTTASPTRRILCLHGWLDNAASFHRLAPLLLQGSSANAADAAEDDNNNNSLDIRKTEIVALDFPGHGKSGHKSVDGPPQLLAEYAYYVAELVEALQWGNNDEGGNTISGGSRTAITNIQRNTVDSQDNRKDKQCPTSTTTTKATNDKKIILVGHSMGAGVATILCAAFPEWFSSLILLEGGLVARNANDAARHVRAACQRRLKSNRTLFPNRHRGEGVEEGVGLSTTTTTTTTTSSPPLPRAKVYSDLDVAIKARMSTTERMPGDQSLSYEAARELVLRATTPAAAAGTTTTTATTTSSTAPDSTLSESVIFRHDPRLQWPSLQYYTREQVEAFYRDVNTSQIPVCFLAATDGWPVESWAENLVMNVLKPVYLKKLSGSHHFHADPDSVHAVADDVLSFLEEQKL